MFYYIIFKPFGMLSQFTPDHKGQITLADLGFSFPKNVYPVGRLDADSEGLLLLTDDKTLNDKLLNPKQHIAKTYRVQVEGIPVEADLDKLRRGVDIQIKGQTYHTLPAKVKLLETDFSFPPRVPPIRFRKTVPESWLEITITEGKNRQIRRMCAVAGFPVLRLIRVGMGNLLLGEDLLTGMVSGEVREVEPMAF